MKSTPRQLGSGDFLPAKSGFIWFLTSLLVGIGISSTAGAQTRKPTEYDVKAAYLYNFGRFIKWPPGSTSNGFSICVYGNDPFGASLDSIVAGESIDGKRISVKRVSSVREASNCQILYVSRSADLAGNLLSNLRGMPVLTVSDMPEFLNRGGMIQFVMQGERVRFEVNLSPVETSGLNLSSELLKVAIDVKRVSQGED